jgi:ferrochelatase
MAHGGPSCLEEVPAFLKTMSGRDPSEETVLRVTERYRRIGGGSPALGLARSIAAKLEGACGLPVYVGMLHWHPQIEEVVRQMAAEEISRVLAICLVPHFSWPGVGKYQSRATAAFGSVKIAADYIDSWYAETGYVNAIVDAVRAARAASSPVRSGSTNRLQPPHVMFTAHSLPKAAVAAGDPYESQVLATANLVAARLGLESGGWTLAYQGAVGPRDRWLGPSMEEALESLASQGVRQVVVCPFGFVLDQVEILYDIDVLLQSLAQRLGVELVRTATLNDGAPLVELLAGLAKKWDAVFGGNGLA